MKENLAAWGNKEGQVRRSQQHRTHGLRPFSCYWVSHQNWVAARSIPFLWTCSEHHMAAGALLGRSVNIPCLRDYCRCARAPWLSIYLPRQAWETGLVPVSVNYTVPFSRVLRAAGIHGSFPHGTLTTKSGSRLHGQVGFEPSASSRASTHH